jgi:hypothetical protein
MSDLVFPAAPLGRVLGGPDIGSAFWAEAPSSSALPGFPDAPCRHPHGDLLGRQRASRRCRRLRHLPPGRGRLEMTAIQLGQWASFLAAMYRIHIGKVNGWSLATPWGAFS